MKKILKFCFNTTAWNPSKTEYIFLMSAIAKEERDKVNRYVFKQNSKQSLIGQVLIRYCLKNLLNVDSNNLCIGRNSKERPYLKLKETFSNAKISNFDNLIDFNVSHNGDYTVICAGMISCNLKKIDDPEGSFRIGTDVMKIDIRNRKPNQTETDESLFEKELAKHERIIESEFSVIEKNFVYSKSNPVEKLSAFFRLWCLKESYVKALGEGLGYEIKRVETIPNSELFVIDLMRKKHLVVDDTKLLVDNKLVKNCKFYEQYFTNHVANKDSTTSRVQLHIMTICVMEKEKLNSKSSSSSSSSSSLLSNSVASNNISESDEFLELNLTDIMPSLVSIDKIDETNSKEFEDSWIKFSEKAESPFIP